MGSRLRPWISATGMDKKFSSGLNDEKLVVILFNWSAACLFIPICCFLHDILDIFLAGWMPLYVYAFPVTAIGACLLALGGIALEGLSLSSSGQICGPFGWVRKGEDDNDLKQGFPISTKHHIVIL